MDDDDDDDSTEIEVEVQVQVELGRRWFLLPSVYAIFATLAFLEMYAEEFEVDETHDQF